MNRFENRIVVVTAAASGIGWAAARRFAAEGASLALCDIDLERLREQAAALGLPDERLAISRTDVSKPSEIEALIAGAAERFGGIDVLVNNAGVGAFGFVTEIAPEVWERIIATTLSSVFYASRAALPHLIRRKGNIVNTASISGLAADVGFAAYNAAKGGVVNLTRAMAIDHAADGIRVNALCPGVVEAGSTAWMVGNADLMRGFADRVPMGRMAQPEEMAGAILFLASDDASYVTGTNLVADGGLLAGTGQPQFRRIVEKAGW